MLSGTSHSTFVYIGVTGIKKLDQCQTGGSAEIAYVDCSVSPAYEVKWVRSVSETAHKLNDSWPGGKLFLILFKNIFLSTDAHISVNFRCTKNLSRLEFHFPISAVDGWNWSYLGAFSIDLLNKINGQRQGGPSLVCDAALKA